MAPEPESEQGGPSFIERLGALCISPRRLARRDLDRRDGKAGDDLIVFGLVVLLANGATSVVRAATSLAAGRIHSALRQLLEVLRPAGPLLVLWLVSAIALLLFTFRFGRRAVGELAARVLTGFLVANVLTTPIAARLEPGRVRYILESLPWAVAAILFGLMLREAVEPLPEAGVPPRALPAAARGWGLALSLLVLTMGARHAVHAVSAVKSEGGTLARRNAPAPAVDLPLLGPGHLQLGELRGRRVVLAFWASWCGPCMEELPRLEEVYRRGGPDSARVFAVNVDEPGPDRDRLVRGVLARFGLTMPIALDDGTASRAYAVSSIPTIVRIDTDGTVRDVFERPLDRDELKDALR